MGGITAVFNADGRPIDRTQFLKIHGISANRGIDGSSEWFGATVAMGHHAFHTTPEALAERQPLRDAGGNLTVVFDGRVDNREELGAALRANGTYPRDDTDAELVLCAYQAWGEDSVKRIIGDFALVIWDAANRRLLCARDHIGIRPLFYYYDGKTFLCGTELRQLLAAPFVPRDMDEDVTGVFLTGIQVDRERTFFRHVKRLRPGHLLTVGADSFKIRRFFQIDGRRRIRYRNDEEYSEHFREIFAEAVRCRLRNPNGVAAIQMSGGLDSTSVAGMARSLQLSGRLGMTRLETYSLIFPGMRADEQKWIRESNAMFGVPAWLIEAAVMDWQHLADAAVRYCDFGDVPNGAMWAPLWAKERERGVRVALTGAGSDEYMTGYGDVPADLFAQLRWGDLYRYMGSQEQRGWQRAESSTKLTYLMRHMLWPFMPAKLKLIYWRASGARIYPDFIKPEFARRINLAARVRSKPNYPGGMSFADRDLYDMYDNAWLFASMEYLDRVTQTAGVEERQPFHDRRLVEFLFAIPAEQRCRDGLIKFVLRNAMRGLIPEMIRTRPDKAGYGDIFLASMRTLPSDIFDSMTLEKLGWIDAQAFRKLFDQQFEPLEDDPPRLWPVWATLALEFWYNRVVLKRDAFPLTQDVQGELEAQRFAQ